jgi:hypothetical protein
VIIGHDAQSLEMTRSHEHVHVCQFERYGILMVVAYPAASLLAWLRGGSLYRDNYFEREAYNNDGERGANRGLTPPARQQNANG